VLNYNALIRIGKHGNFWHRGWGVLSASLATVVVWSQDDPQFATDKPPALRAAPVAEPIPPGGAVIPPQMPIAAPVTPGAPQMPGGLNFPQPTGSLAGYQGQSRLIEVIIPERVPVYPDDPDSAWWEVNPHAAFDRAQREQRPLLLVFTATWNTQAMALSQEVFATKSFNEFVKENLVICFLSYPKNFTDAPETLRVIKDKYKVKGYPNTLLFTPNGEVEKGISGYRPGKPIDYFNRLKALCLPLIESIEIRKSELVKMGFRNWSNYLGKEIFARFIEHDETHVVIQDAIGQKWTVKKNDLAPEDQKLVESFPPIDKVDSQPAK